MSSETADKMESRKSRAQRVDYKRLNEYGKEYSELEGQDLIKRTGSQTGNNKVLEIFSDEDCGDQDDVTDDLADESVRLEEELRLLEREEKRLIQQKKVQDLRRRVEEKKKCVKGLRGETNNSLSKLPTKDNLSIQDLRRDQRLRAKIKKIMYKTGLDIFKNDSSDSDSESDKQYNACQHNISSCANRYSDSRKSQKKHISISSSKKKCSGGKKSKKPQNFDYSSDEIFSSSSDDESDDGRSAGRQKSGILSTPSDHVRFRQRYPQAYLRYEHVNSKVSFEKLDFNLFVAVELEIISNSSISTVEREARLELLKRLMYLNSSYDFTVLKNLYAAILREIKLGRKTWGDDFQYVETGMLNSRLLKKNSTSFYKRSADVKHVGEEIDNDDKAWFCSLYQRNKCAQRSSHTLVVKGKMRWAQHICASCYQKDRNKLNQPECSSACPHSGARA